MLTYNLFHKLDTRLIDKETKFSKIKETSLEEN